MVFIINSSRRSSVFFFLLLLSLTFSLIVANRDRDRELCERRCWQQHKSSHQERDQCLQTCEDYYGEKKHHGRGGGGGGGGDEDWGGRIVLNSEVDPEKQLQQCQKQCEHQQGREKDQCRRQCRETYERQRGEEGGQGGDNRHEEQGQGQGQGQEENPYVFRDEHYGITHDSEEGRVKILSKFHQRSRLLQGLENYRFLSIKANPQTFVLPSHLDADTVLYVSSGRGTLNLVSQGKRESFNIKQGDVVTIPAGTTLYMTNGDNKKSLRMAMMLQPVALPGEFQAFYGAAGYKPPSFYKAFSPELLATALQAERRKVQRVITQQNKGVIVKASEQQIRALTQREEAGMFPFSFGSSETKRVFNLLSKEPSVSNRYGRLQEVDANDFPGLFQTKMTVSYVNITKGAMQGPLFNTRSTKVAMVVRGEGYMEMACPHIAQEQQQQQGQGQGQEQQEEQQQEEEGLIQHYKRVSSNLKSRMLIVVPAGHPILLVAGTKKNLEIVCFNINAENKWGNWKESLAGDKNPVNAMKKEAKELAFGVPAREVDEVFGRQKELFFFPGPREGRTQG